ncbi:glycosyl hydrolase 115 family protein [Sphingomonas sp. Root241]|uniref:glycosyl hydrolase 115 family protein n=1 Tax=Sphingomonas sp. Root241 TaxID=1736501 RepID=UPI000A431CB5|nr:glycosyl hydrolase 115 family protein [Sphingomonas sp. Root241]
MNNPSSRIVAFVLTLASLGYANPALACHAPVSVCTKASTTSFGLITNGRPVPVIVDADADGAVKDAASAFSRDVARVAGAEPLPLRSSLGGATSAVLIGQLGNSPLIADLVKRRRIDVSDIVGKWEGYRQIVVDDPFPGVRRALVIVGSDRRGAIFGSYDISEKIGVSPWSWWADVPVRRRTNLYITAGARADAPKVQYRGIFINDEDPAFGTWARRKFGGVNAKAYAHVFDLVLRLKGNYLWPAMWGKAIGTDDPQSMPLADAKGIVLGTSHHEPMTRAQSEWHRNKEGGVTGGAWDYTTNAANLRSFWRGGIERMMSKGNGRGYEQLVTVGMRGDGDEPMAEGTAIGLLERVVRDQRQIIAEVTGRPAEETPQVWALYKEVQDYYDRGMKVPDDVTLLFADDNWGQIRRLPSNGTARKGGYGVYYHFDYVGGPRSYKWLNTVQIEKTWQQMDLAYRTGARTIWIVNVGDIKPMEFPIDFFLKMAWNPEAMTAQKLAAFPRDWASATFGSSLGPVIGDLISDYSRLAARRKPELVNWDSYRLGEATPNILDGGEFGAIVDEWDALARKVRVVKGRLSSDQHDAFFQLVEYPVEAMTNLHHLYYAVAWNRRLASAKDARANIFAENTEAAFARDAELKLAYHKLNGGKWDGMMLQTKFGYTSWNDPRSDVMPAVSRVEGQPGPVRFGIAQPTGNRSFAAAEAVDFTRSRGGKGLAWRAIPRLGRTAGAVGTFPQGQPATAPADDVRLDYDVTLPSSGDATLRLYMVPTLDTRGGNGLRIGVSIDNGPVQSLTMSLKVDDRDWAQAVRDNAFPLEARLGRLASGRHTVKLWRIDGNVFVQKLVLYTGELPPTYLGPAPVEGKERP